MDECKPLLDGGARMRLRLDPPPPCGAFWSLTLYTAPDGFLSNNPWRGGAG